MIKKIIFEYFFQDVLHGNSLVWRILTDQSKFKNGFNSYQILYCKFTDVFILSHMREAMHSLNIILGLVKPEINLSRLHCKILRVRENTPFIFDFASHKYKSIYKKMFIFYLFEFGFAANVIILSIWFITKTFQILGK